MIEDSNHKDTETFQQYLQLGYVIADDVRLTKNSKFIQANEKIRGVQAKHEVF